MVSWESDKTMNVMAVHFLFDRYTQTHDIVLFWRRQNFLFLYDLDKNEEIQPLKCSIQNVHPVKSCSHKELMLSNGASDVPFKERLLLTGVVSGEHSL